MTDKEIEAGIKRACECDCAPPSTGWTVNPFPIIRDYIERLKRRAEVMELCGGDKGVKAFCPFCEKEYNNLEVQTRYEITTLNGVTAEWQKKYIVCPDCGEELYNGKLHDANLRVVYAACKVSDIDKPVEDLCDYVLKLRMENAELRERLNKAVELQFSNGDEVYAIMDTLLYTGVIPVTIKSADVVYEVFDGEQTTAQHRTRIFTTRAEAEARLGEIQGGEK